MIRRSARFAAAVLAALLTPVLLAAVVAVAVLAQGPVSLPLLNRQLAGALSAVDPQLRASIGDTVLAWNSGSHRLEIRLVDARITDPQGAPLAAFGSARVDLSGLDLLLGRIVPTAVQLIRPELRVLREADGTLYLQAEAGGEDWPLARLLAAFGNRPHQGEERRLLRQLSARHARLTFEDRGSGFTATTDDAALSAIDGEGATSLSFDAAMRIRGEPVRIGLGAVRHDGAQAFDVSLHFSELALGSLPAMTGLAALAPLDGAEPALNGNVDFTLVPDGRLGEVSFLVDVGSGAVPLPDRLPEPLQVQRGHLRGSVQPVSGHVVLSDVQLAMTDGLNLYYAGEASDVLGTPAITGSGGFQDLQVSRLANYWPRGVARGARAWVTQHVSGGTIPAAQLKLDIRPGELSAAEPRAGMAELTWRFKGVRSDYLGKLPPLREAEGSGHVDAHSFRLEVERAQVLDLAVSNGEVSVPDLGMKIPRIDIAMQVDGPAGSALKVIDADPLNYVRAIGLNAARVGGRASVKTTLSFPLDADLKLEQIDFTSTAQVHGFSAPYIIGGRPVSRGDMTLKAQQSGLQAGGTVRVSGVPLSVEWRRAFTGKAVAEGDRFHVEGRLDDRQRAALGLDDGDYVEGPVAMVADISVAGPVIEGSVHADLADTTLAVPELKWRKPTGRPAEVTLAVHSETGKGTVLRDIDLQTPGLAFRGAVALDPEQRFKRLHAERLAVNGSDIAADVKQPPAGPLSVNLHGGALDLRPYLHDMLEPDAGAAPAKASPPESGDGEAPLDLIANLDEVRLTDDIRVAGLRAVGARRAGGWNRLEASGALNGGPAIRLTIEPKDGHRKLELVSGDAGAILRVLDVFADMQNGRMRLVARLPDDPTGKAPITGTLRADDFRITNAPVLARIFNVGSLTGMLDLLRGEGIAFKRLDAPFTLQGDRLHIQDARAVGSATGLMATVDYNRKTGAIAAEGTVVPSYTINSVLGNIPLIGEVLVGRKGEGVFALNYKVSGTANDPKVTVNPLSALAPGILREFLRGLEQPAVPGEKNRLQEEHEEERTFR